MRQLDLERNTDYRPVRRVAAFYLVLGVVVVLTLLAGGVALWLAVLAPLAPPQDRIFESAIATWQMGVGAIFGLLGSKAAEGLPPEEE